MRVTAEVAGVRVIWVVFGVTCYFVGYFMSLRVDDSILAGITRDFPRGGSAYMV